MTAQTEKLRSDLRALLGAANLLTSKEDLIAYSFDGTAALQQMPGCVVFANSTADVAGVLKLANESKTAGQENIQSGKGYAIEGHSEL